MSVAAAYARVYRENPGSYEKYCEDTTQQVGGVR